MSLPTRRSSLATSLFSVVFALTLLTAIPAAKAGKNVPAASCSALLAQFENVQKGAKEYQELRFLKPLNGLSEMVKNSKSLDETIQILSDKDGRKFTFYLEGLFKVFGDVYGKKFKDWRYRVKAFEDHLGAYGDATTFHEYAIKKGGSPQYALKAMAEKEETSHEEFRKFLVKDGWFTADGKIGSSFLELATFVMEADWYKFSKERTKILETIAGELKDDVEDLDYDMDVLEDGIHKLRRKLRWFLIYLQAFDGLFELTDNTLVLREYSYLVDHPIASSPFSKMDPNPLVEDPATLPRHVFLAMSKLVEDLGKIKSVGERINAIAEAFLESGRVTSRREAQARAEEIVGETFDSVHQKAHAVKDELERTQLVHKLRKMVEKQE